MNLKQFKKHRVRIIDNLSIMILKLEDSIIFLKDKPVTSLNTYDSYFLCNMLHRESISQKYLASQKPNGKTNTEFTKHLSYTGRIVWWETLDGRVEISVIIKEKIRFINHIKAKL